jgi:hypothetical protein
MFNKIIENNKLFRKLNCLKVVIDFLAENNAVLFDSHSMVYEYYGFETKDFALVYNLTHITIVNTHKVDIFSRNKINIGNYRHMCFLRFFNKEVFDELYTKALDKHEYRDIFQAFGKSFKIYEDDGICGEFYDYEALDEDFINLPYDLTDMVLFRNIDLFKKLDKNGLSKLIIGNHRSIERCTEEPLDRADIVFEELDYQDVTCYNIMELMFFHQRITCSCGTPIYVCLKPFEDNIIPEPRFEL